MLKADTQHQHAQASDDVLDDLLSDTRLEKKTWVGCAEAGDTLQRIGSAVVDALNALNKLSTYETRCSDALKAFWRSFAGCVPTGG